MQMDRSVYSHDTVNITETMLERSVENHIKSEKEDMESLLGLYDYQLSDILVNSNNKPSRELFNNIQNRNLYKTAYFDQLDDADEDNMLEIINVFSNVREHESNIADIANLEDYKVLISLPKYKHIDKFKSPIETASGQIKELESVSPKPNSLRSSQLTNANFHIFTDEEHREIVKKSASDYLNSFDCIDSIIE